MAGEGSHAIGRVRLSTNKTGTRAQHPPAGEDANPWPRERRSRLEAAQDPRCSASRLSATPQERLVRSNYAAARAARHLDFHRRHLTQLVEEAAPAHGQGHLMIIGGGNCRDWNLPKLADSFNRITLVDIDGDALMRARDTLPRSVALRCTWVAGLDVLGLFCAGSRNSLGASLESAHAQLSSRVESADVVVSDFVLCDSFGAMAQGSLLEEKERALVVREHLLALRDLTRQGGQALLLGELLARPKGQSEAPPASGVFPVAPPAGALRSSHLHAARSAAENRTCEAEELPAWTARFADGEPTIVGGTRLRISSLR